MLFAYCGAAGSSSEVFPVDEEDVLDEDDAEAESVFDEDDADAGSVPDEDDVTAAGSVSDEDDVTAVGSVFDEESVPGIDVESVDVELVAVPPSAAAAGIALYNGESTITAAKRNASSFTLVFFMLFSFCMSDSFVA